MVPFGIPCKPKLFFCVFTPCESSLCETNSAAFGFDFMTFHSSGVSLLTGQWFLSVSPAMLSIATLDGFLSKLGVFRRSEVHISWKKKRKSSPSFFFLILFVSSQYILHNKSQKWATYAIFMIFVVHISSPTVEKQDLHHSCCGCNQGYFLVFTYALPSVSFSACILYSISM